MSPGVIAVTAIAVSGTEVLALIAVGAWLIYKQRILLAASPKPQQVKQPGKDAAAQPQQPGGDERPVSVLGGPSKGEAA